MAIQESNFLTRPQKPASNTGDADSQRDLVARILFMFGFRVGKPISDLLEIFRVDMVKGYTESSERFWGVNLRVLEKRGDGDKSLT